jgi:chitin synthase
LLGTRGGAGGNARGGVGSTEDRDRFEQLKQAFKLVGLSKRLVAQICQLVAAILHIGNLDFVVDHDRNVDAAVVKNWDVLETVGEFLGVSPVELEGIFNCKTTVINKDVCTVFLDPDGASANRDDLAKALYSLLFAWLNENINERLCRDDFATFIGILDLPGFQNLSGFGARANSIDQFCVNFANERLHNWILQSTFERQTAEFAAEDLTTVVPNIPFFDNSECVRMLSSTPGGLVHIMDDQTRRMGKKTDHTMADAFTKRWGNHASFKSGTVDRAGFPTFTVSHYNGAVTYSVENFLEKNADAVNPDFVSLLRGHAGAGGAGAHNAGLESIGSSNPFIKDLFSSAAIATQVHPRDAETIIAAQQPVKPMRAPSTRRKGGRGPRMAALGEEGDEEDDSTPAPLPAGSEKVRCVVGEFKASLDVLFEAFDETKSWNIFCLNPNDVQLPNQLESRGLKSQIRSLGLPEMAKKAVASFEVSMTHSEFVERYAAEVENVPVGTAPETIRHLRESRGWPEKELAVGKFKVRFLSFLYLVLR